MEEVDKMVMTYSVSHSATMYNTTKIRPPQRELRLTVNTFIRDDLIGSGTLHH